MKKVLKLLGRVLALLVVGVILQQVITLFLPEGRKAKSDEEVYIMESREGLTPADDPDWSHLKYNKINKGPYDVQYSQKIVEPYNIFAAVLDYEAYCELCKELEIRQTYTNSEADYIVWKVKASSWHRVDIVNVIDRGTNAMVYLKSSVNFLRGKNKSGRAIIVPVKKDTVETAGIGDAYRFDFERTPCD